MRSDSAPASRIDRAAVEDTMTPAAALLGDPWFAWSLLVTWMLVGLAIVIDVLVWRMMAAAFALIAALIGLWYLARYFHRQRRRTKLIRDGQRHPALGVRSVAVLWFKRDMASIYRWAAVADWTDATGQLRSSLTGPYDYDPQPLLKGVSATVLADPADVSNAMLLPQGLPPLRHRALDPAQRSKAPGTPQLSRVALIILIVALLFFVLLGSLLFLPIRSLPTTGIGSTNSESLT